MFLLFFNISAQKTITCKKVIYIGQVACKFSGVTIGPNEAVSIKTDPTNLDVNSIIWVEFEESSIHSVPSEVFTKFQNLIIFDILQQKLQEVQKNAFEKGKKLELIRLHSNELTFLHLDTFKGELFNFLIFFRSANLRKFISKGLTELRTIWLENNKLSAMHPRMFAHLTKLNDLDMQDNPCIDKRFKPVTSLAAVEKELMTCGANYLVSLTDLPNALNRHERKFESIEKAVNEKFVGLQIQLQEREKKVDRKFELLTELFYNVDERNEENAADIKEIKKMVEKIWDMLNSK